jgi:hypothetical protein
MPKSNKMSLLKVSALSLALLVTGNAVIAGPLESSLATEKKINQASVNTQKRIDNLSNKTIDLQADYKQKLQLIDSLRIYNNQLEKLIQSQNDEIASINREMETIDTTERGVIPLMNEMITSIDKFIQLDVPFKLKVRENRVQKLKTYMIRADIQNSEKYRKILEAYQTEIGYGESIDAYQGVIKSNGEEVRVDFLQMGRIALVYLTLDGTGAGFFNKETKRFEKLDDSYIRSIEQGLKMAQKQATMNLIELPIPAATRAK